MRVETNRKISFGTDGFRGVISADFTYENIRKIAQGFSDFLAYKGFKRPDTKVIIGYDRRFLSERFAREFAVVLVNNDIDTTLSLTPIPTPAVSYLTTKGFRFGVVITASHNNFLYNGVKIKYEGRSIPPNMSAEIELYIEKNISAKISRIPKKEIPEYDFRKDYVGYIRERLKIDEILSQIKSPVVVDFMYGCASEVYEELFSRYKNIIPIRTKRDPLFGDISAPEPKEDKLEALKKAVKENKAICGFALDGDGDRCGCIDENSNYLPPTIISPIILDYLINNKKLTGRVVQAVSLGFLTQRIARNNNLLFEFTPVGFKYIAQRMKEGDVLFGAEESGGYSWKGNIPERDGIMTMMMMLEIISTKNKPLSYVVKEIKEKYGESYFIREDLTLNKIIPSKYTFAMKVKNKLPKEILSSKIKDIITLDGIKVILENDWWFLARPSGTEPLLRIYAEAETKEDAAKLILQAKELVSTAIS